MTHLVYCDNVGKKGERPIDKILAGIKTMVVRGAAGRKNPQIRVSLIYRINRLYDSTKSVFVLWNLIA